MSIDPENPLTIGKRARTEDGALVTAVNSEILIPNRDGENPLVPSGAIVPVDGVRKIVKVRPRKPAAPIPENPELVPVVGNNRVLRCRRCMTFVKQGAAHSKLECDARIAHKAASKNRPATSRKRKFRMTPRRRLALTTAVTQATMGQTAFKVMKSIEKWIQKKQNRLSKTSKKMFGRLIGAFHMAPDNKKLQANLRRCGL